MDPRGKLLELRDYIRILWRRRWLVVITFAVAAASALFWSSRQAPVYEGVAKVFIGPRSADRADVSTALEELSFSRDFIASYAELFKSRPLAERVVERLGLRIDAVELSRRVRANVVQQTRIIEVSVTGNEAAGVANIVNVLTETFIAEVQQEFGGRAGVQATVFEPAIPPTGRVSPRPLRNGMIASVLGLLLGVGLAVFREQFDTRIRTSEDLEHLTATPVLAEVPTFAGSGGKREFFIEQDPRSPTAEAFRILRTNVQFLAVDRPIRRLLVTSPYAEDGKTTVAGNLAASLAAAGYRTLIIDADLRRPRAHDFFEIPLSPGLSDVLVRSRPLDSAIRETRIANLFVMTSGGIPPNPSELLGSERMVEVIEEAGELVDVIVVDSPPTLPVTDAPVLAPRTDGVIMVVRSNRTHKERAKGALAQFERAGVRVLGLVLNAVDHERTSRYYGGYYYSSPDNGSGSREPSSSREETRTADFSSWER